MPKRGVATVVGGVRYRSGFEAAVAADLIARGVEPHHEEERIPYTTPHVYVADFAPRRSSDGKPVIVEAKGHLDRDDRRTILAVKALGIDIRVVFQRAKNRINRGSKTTYAQWADKNNIPWAEGRVPEEWLR